MRSGRGEGTPAGGEKNPAGGDGKPAAGKSGNCGSVPPGGTMNGRLVKPSCGSGDWRNWDFAGFGFSLPSETIIYYSKQSLTPGKNCLKNQTCMVDSDF